MAPGPPGAPASVAHMPEAGGLLVKLSVALELMTGLVSNPLDTMTSYSPLSEASAAATVKVENVPPAIATPSLRH